MSELNPTPEPVTNVTLIGYLTRLGWSPEQLAYHLNRLARSLRLSVPEMHPKTPRRWLIARSSATRPCAPRQPWPGLVCALLSRHLQGSVTLASLGWQMSVGALYVPADDGLHHPWDPRDAVRLAESALTGAKDLTPAIAAWIQGRLTTSAAYVGDAAAADRARGRMFELTSAIDPAAEPPWIYWWSDAEAHYHAGQSALAKEGRAALRQHRAGQGLRRQVRLLAPPDISVVKHFSEHCGSSWIWCPLRGSDSAHLFYRFWKGQRECLA
ncbi:MAG: hypothetical protein ACREMZ_17520 [Gemmatimonadales bacterium]